MPEEAHLYPHLSGREYLQLTGRLRGMPHSVLEPRIDEFLRLFSLWDDRSDPLSSYSKGMRQKILLSAALLHNPDLLILDEPFSGLDVTAAMGFRRLLEKLADQGKMILFSSHALEVVEKVCTKAVILRKGEVVAYDSIDRLQQLMRQSSLEGVFAQLTHVENIDVLAGRILDAMKSPATDGSARPVTFGVRACRRLAEAFPQEFKNVYGDELMEVTEEAVEPLWRRHGVWGLLRLLSDFAIRVPIEHLAELGHDVRYGLRSLISSPGFSAVALLSLSLGISIAVCAFSQMNGMALRSLPGIERPGELVALQSPVSYMAFERVREVFSSSAAYAAPVPFGVSIGGASTRRVWGHLVSASYFSTFGVRPALGTFAMDGSPRVVVSHRFWRDHLGGDDAAIGRTLRINGHVCSVSGVAPAEFLGASPMLLAADLWMYIGAGGDIVPELAGNALERRDVEMFSVVGRLGAGVSVTATESAVNTAISRFDSEVIQTDLDSRSRRVLLVQGGKMLPLRKEDVPFFTSFLSLMAGLIMTIACANLATMMLARAARRRREIAIRLSMGASRVRLIRQLLTESTLLALAAGVIGFTGAVWLMGLGSQVRMPFPMPVAYDLRPDGQVLLWTFAMCLGTGILFGLVPALQATKTDVAGALKEGSDLHLGSRRRLSFRRLLIVTQVAGSLTILVALGVLSLGIQTTLGIQAGFTAKGLYAIAIDPVRDGIAAAEASTFFDKLMNRVRTIPEMSAAALTETVPVSMPGSSAIIRIPDGQAAPVRAIRHVTGNGYFETAGIDLEAGRSFHPEDEVGNSTAVIVSAALARALWSEADPVGRTVEIQRAPAGAAKVLPGAFDYRPLVHESSKRFEVIGVAADITEGLTIGKPRPAIYFPLRKAAYAQPPVQGITMLLRAASGRDALVAVRREVASLDGRVTPFDARSMEEQIERFMAPLRMAAWTYALVGLFGVVLACVGIAGVTGYSVAQRRREIGIRIALGARRRQVLAVVMKEGLVLASAGTMLGMVGAWQATTFLAAMNASVGTVSSTSSNDPLVLFGAPLLLLLVAIAACYLPARRSTEVNPVVALRQE